MKNLMNSIDKINTVAGLPPLKLPSKKNPMRGIAIIDAPRVTATRRAGSIHLRTVRRCRINP